MNEKTFETATRHAASVLTRRGSLRTLGAAALAAAISAPSLAQAKKGGKKSRGNGSQRCRRQAAGCRKVVTELCGDESGVCEAVLASCPSLGRCNATAFFDCVIAID